MMLSDPSGQPSPPVLGQATPPVPFRELSWAWLRHRHLHRNGWTSPHHGFWSDRPAADEPLQRIVDASAVLPDGGAIGGWSAAYLHGVTTLNGNRWDGTTLDVMACVDRTQQVRRPGIDDFRSRLLPQDVTTVDGVRVTSLVRTAFDLARRAEDLIEAVCV